MLDLLDKYNIKATFFLVGDNVRRNPQLFEEIKRRGHSYGNHTMHHLQGFKVERRRYMRDITEADNLIGSPLFRPPHGIIRWSQAKAIKNHYNIIMYDLVTRDYSKVLTPQESTEQCQTICPQWVDYSVPRLAQSRKEYALGFAARCRMASPGRI